VRLREELDTFHKEHQELHEDAEDISRNERSIKWQVSIQNALGVVLAASIMGTATLLWHWYNAAGEVRAEITHELAEIRQLQITQSAGDAYHAKDLGNAISRIEELEKFARHGKRFTWDDGQDLVKRISALELGYALQRDHETRMRVLESGFASIQGSLKEIIRRLDGTPSGESAP
jgi:hypothetical protein